LTSAAVIRAMNSENSRIAGAGSCRAAALSQRVFGFPPSCARGRAGEGLSGSGKSASGIRSIANAGDDRAGQGTERGDDQGDDGQLEDTDKGWSVVMKDRSSNDKTAPL